MLHTKCGSVKNIISGEKGRLLSTSFSKSSLDVDFLRAKDFDSLLGSPLVDFDFVSLLRFLVGDCGKRRRGLKQEA